MSQNKSHTASSELIQPPNPQEVGPLKQASDYAVGYKKPPKHSQFKKGQSGNRKGRPKGKSAPKVKTYRGLTYELPEEKLKETFLKEAYRLVNINTGQGEESLPISQAVIRALGVKAAKGHISAQRLFANTLFELEAQERKLAEDRMDHLVNYKKSWTEELRRREAQGLPLDPPVPHPDDIVLNMQTGTLEIIGPLDEDEKAKIDHYRALLKDWEDSTESSRTYLENYEARGGEHEDIDQRQRDFLTSEIESGEKIISMLKQLIGDKEPDNLWEREKARRKLLAKSDRDD